VQYDSDLDRFQGIAKSLTRYAVVDRYPDDWREIPKDEASIAVQNAESLMKTIADKIEHSSPQ
jgi:HEPN domain-containing protein